jgi:very-short-patch-repair endonuclease
LANEIARRLRKTMTPQEVKVWAHLRRLRHERREWRFRRQVPLRGYIVDFACFRARLIVEIDGSQHGFEDHAARDRVRDEVLERAGFGVLRFWNAEVDRDFEGVWTTIMNTLRDIALSEQYPEAPSSPIEGEQGLATLSANA